MRSKIVLAVMLQAYATSPSAFLSVGVESAIFQMP